MSNIINLQSGVTGTATGDVARPADPFERRVVRAEVSGTGAVTATVEIYGSTTNSTDGAVLLGTITLSGTTLAADGFAFDAPWPFIFSKVTAISGTGATVLVQLAS